MRGSDNAPLTYAFVLTLVVPEMKDDVMAMESLLTWNVLFAVTDAELLFGM